MAVRSLRRPAWAVCKTALANSFADGRAPLPGVDLLLRLGPARLTSRERKIARLRELGHAAFLPGSRPSNRSEDIFDATAFLKDNLKNPRCRCHISPPPELRRRDWRRRIPVRPEGAVKLSGFRIWTTRKPGSASIPFRMERCAPAPPARTQPDQSIPAPVRLDARRCPTINAAMRSRQSIAPVQFCRPQAPRPPTASTFPSTARFARNPLSGFASLRTGTTLGPSSSPKASRCAARAAG